MSQGSMTSDLSERSEASGLPSDIGAYRSALFQYFRGKTRDQNEIEDLVQEVFLRIAARRGSQIVENFGAYVMQTAVSVSADGFRRKSVRQSQHHIEYEAEFHGGCDFDAARILEGREALRAAVAALQSLPERTRDIFILRRVDGFAYRDISARFGISVSAVEKHVIRAVQHLISMT